MWVFDQEPDASAGTKSDSSDSLQLRGFIGVHLCAFGKRSGLSILGVFGYRGSLGSLHGADAESECAEGTMHTQLLGQRASQVVKKKCIVNLAGSGNSVRRHGS
jgi:hypothetical protein